jgi:hypothetical protein
METELPAFLANAFSWLERSSFGETVRMVPRLYPVLMSLHVLGIALLVGPAFAVDLRLLGVGRGIVPVTLAARCLLPLSHVGFAIVLMTGLAMFPAIALTAGGSAAAPWKFGLIGLAGVNILLFHKGVYRSVASWDLGAPTPLAAKAAAMVSAVSWVGTIFAGRFLAY